MPALRQYEVNIELKIKINSAETISKVQEEAVAKMTKILSERNTPHGHDAYTEALQNLFVIKD